MSLPNVFMIGAAKCGTTSLQKYLIQHPDVFSVSEKECHFFDDEDFYKKGPDSYTRAFFKDSESYKIRMDATPAYLRFYEKIPRRIFDLYGNKSSELKFICVFRDPVDRAWSHYLHMKRLGLEVKGFEEALRLEDDRLKNNRSSNWWGYISDGQYAKQLKGWLSVFDKSQFLIITSDQLKSNPNSTMDKVSSFLGVDVFNDYDFKISSNKARAVKSRLVADLVNSKLKFTKPIIKGLIGPVLLRKIKFRINSINTREYINDERPLLSPDLKPVLRDFFHEDLCELEKMFELDLTSWKK